MTPEEEAQCRTDRDGIPRYVTEDGRIMKCDWELSTDEMEDPLVGESLETYVVRLMEEQK